MFYITNNKLVWIIPHLFMSHNGLCEYCGINMTQSENSSRVITYKGINYTTTDTCLKRWHSNNPKFDNPLKPSTKE